MPGSGASAYDNKDWIQNLMAFIQHTYYNFKHIKFLSICFGMQITVKTFGGTVQPLEGRRISKTFHLIGNATVNLSEKMKEVKALNKMNLPSSMIINKAHGDQVTDFPEMFENYASSDLCKNEILISKDFRILCLQSHPEFSSTYQRIFCTQINSSCQDRPLRDLREDPEYNQKWNVYADSIGREICR
jgi:GMP synthase-like glutamine amidotransferase